ncbi:MAG TPA: TonB-dependent receptor [Steroidobacteraceae bacterium]|nr:TonB-dependent receptor [Steroidobacteraceae bacterium]
MMSDNPARRSIRRAVRLGILAALSAGPVAVQAQQAPVEAPTLQEVVVTGSRILRQDTNTPSPVQILTADDIARSGFTSTSDLLHALTSNGEGNLNQSFNGAFAAGASGISLRGMTVDATLVLIDGHRMANYPISDDGQRSFVDVASLPMSAIDHIEVLKDGASAVYGSDALAGVVNIILKKQITGLELVADGGTSAHNDGANEHFAATYGFGDLTSDGHNTYLSLEWRHQDALPLTHRPAYANFDYASIYGPAAPTAFGIIQPGAAYPFQYTANGMILPYIPAGDGTTPTAGTVASFVTPCTTGGTPLTGCEFNHAAYLQIEPETSNYNVLLRHTMNLSSNWTAQFTASLFGSKAEQATAPSYTLNVWPALTGGVNAEDPAAQPILLPVGNPNNPYPNNAAWLAYSFADVGAQRALTDTRMYRLVADLNGEIAGWTVSASVGAVRGLTYLTYENYVTLTGLEAVIANNSYVIGGNNSAAVYNTLAPTTHSIDSTQLQYLDVSGTRPLFDLPGGPLSIAIGGGARHDGQDVPGQPGSLVGNVIGVGTTYIHGTDTSENVYVELDAPIIKSLEVDLAGRFDNYATVGTATTPKAGFKWQPLQQIMLRGTYSRGFRAPGPGERGNSGVTFFSATPSDPARCPFTNLPDDCGSGSGSAVVQGTPSLKPEHSTNYTAGIVLTPIREISLSVDWWEIRRSGEIISDFADGNFVRGPVQPAYPDLPGPIVSYVAPYRNLGVDMPKGIDYELHVKYPIGPGTAAFDAYYSHLISQEICQSSDPSTCADVAGTHGSSGISGDTGTPADKASATLAYTVGPGELGITMNYVSDMANVDPTLSPDCLNSWYTACKISSFTDFDLFGHYDINDKLTVSFHVLNLFDRGAPFDPQAGYGQDNYNTAFAQQGAIGRFFELGFKWKPF